MPAKSGRRSLRRTQSCRGRPYLVIRTQFLTLIRLAVFQAGGLEPETHILRCRCILMATSFSRVHKKLDYLRVHRIKIHRSRSPLLTDIFRFNGAVYCDWVPTDLTVSD